MKAEDLRIGNLLQTGQAVLEVRTIGIDGCDLRGVNIVAAFSSDYDGVEPIPLSPSWLERAGFTDTNSQSHKVYNEFGNIFPINKINGTYEFVWGAIEIQYVHQLQNLYYALTGNELTFNL